MKKRESAFLLFILFMLTGCGEITESNLATINGVNIDQAVVKYYTSFTIIQRFQQVGGTKILNMNIGGGNSYIFPPSSISANFQTLSTQIVEEGVTYQTIGFYNSIYCEWLNAQVPSMYWDIDGVWRESFDMKPSTGGQVYLKWVPMNLTSSSTYTITAYVN